MKNFKLLLATTAILSTGALMANAVTFDGETETVQVRAELLKARTLKNTQTLDFGRIVFEAGVSELYVDMNSSGVVSIGVNTAGGDAYVHTQGKVGIVTGATCDQLAVTYANTDDAQNKKIQLTPPSGKSVEHAHIAGLTCVTDGTTSKFHAELGITNDISGEEIPEGVYTGSFTVTAVYPEETNSGNSGGE